MPKTFITPPGTQTPIAPFSPGTLSFDKVKSVAHVGKRS